jgi:hypothetical protein
MDCVRVRKISRQFFSREMPEVEFFAVRNAGDLCCLQFFVHLRRRFRKIELRNSGGTFYAVAFSVRRLEV